MPARGADRTDAPAPVPEHARHRAPRADASRRPALLVCLVLAVAAAAVVGVVLLQQPSGGPGAGRSAASSTSSTAASGGAASSAPGAPSSTPGDAQAAAVWLAGQPSQSGAVAVDPALYDEVAASAQLAARLLPAPLQAPGGPLDARWVVAGPALRAEAAPGSWAAQALAASRPVAVFGDGDDRVEVREIGAGAAASAPVVPLAAGGDPTTSPPVTSAPARPTATAAGAAALAELVRNPRLDFSPRARAALGSEQVDLRLAALLVQLATQQPLSVSDLPATDGSEPVRTAVVDGLDGQAVGADPDALAALQQQLAGQDPAYRATAERSRDGSTPVLRLVLPSAGA